MIQKTLLGLILLLSTIQVVGQTEFENRNRAVYNRIEYFFNTQQTDSIYDLADADFKKSIPFTEFENIIQYFYLFGKIKEAKPVTLNQGIIGYNVSLEKKTSYLQLGVNNNYKFNAFAWQDQPLVTIEAKDIKSNVIKTTSLDHYVDSIAKTYLSNPNTASLAIGIVHNNKVNTFFYGETTKGDKTSLPTANSIYEIGSLSKIFTSILLADLVENNIINLDDSIAKFLPDSVKNNSFIQKITFKQLANHTSGLPRLPNNFDKAPNYNKLNPYATYSQRELYDYLKDVNLLNEPGEYYEYSNLGFGLLSDIICSITQKTYEQNIKETIAIPLGLTNTVEKIDPKIQKMVNIYNSSGTEVPAWDFQALTGAGSLKSTVHDLLRFAQYQFKMPENNLENALALARQFTFYLPPNTDIGLGWHMNMTDDVISYFHAGATGGCTSFIAIVPDLKSAIVILSNSQNNLDNISGQILQKVLTTK